ncbi:MAG: PAS domain-containing protein [Gammaproteobacteria bacterium]|nr:PAS domain-containing protein [Gammaproteobacteria bacterium]
MTKIPYIKPTNSEKVMRDSDFIVSKTDSKGKITYCNQIFMEFSGYTEKELLEKPHSIIRHPDMPRAAFRLMWQTLENGDEFFAYVKNLSKDGGFYWVFANVTPNFDQQHNICGYFSVRRKPSAQAIETLIPVYTEMCRIESSISGNKGIDASTEYLVTVLNSLGKSYNELVLSFQ